MKVGMIGLGIMGKPMAKNLMKGGYTELLVNARNQAVIDDVVSAGARAAAQPEIGEECDVVLTMLPNSPHVKEVMLGEDGVAAHMRPGTVFIDMSSINPVASKEIAAELKEQMGLEVDKKKIQLKETIKTVGTHEVPIKLHPKVTATLKVIVTEES